MFLEIAGNFARLRSKQARLLWIPLGDRVCAINLTKQNEMGADSCMMKLIT